MKIALVTGASSGMGKEAACFLAEHAKKLDEIWLVARRKEEMQKLEKQYPDVKFRIFAMDLLQEVDEDELILALNVTKPKIKYLVNASGFGKIGSFRETSEKNNTNMVRLNCEALTRMTYIALPYMPQDSYILQFASSAAFVPQPGFSVYAASKSYVLSLSLALNQELKARKIHVTAICPGPVKTEFFDVAQEKAEIKLYKKLVMANPKKVVKKAFLDAKKGKTVSVYGGTMKAFRCLCKVLPHQFILKFIK
ncbi:MAG: SDR family NAD(P)-dependent oxidoreductase [Lachnospiraceae bacterium]|nr:SDR family NAD(P)-dependent oxidoreductase [Lachnospiraceae bacterium]